MTTVSRFRDLDQLEDVDITPALAVAPRPAPRLTDQRAAPPVRPVRAHERVSGGVTASWHVFASVPPSAWALRLSGLVAMLALLAAAVD